MRMRKTDEMPTEAPVHPVYLRLSMRKFDPSVTKTRESNKDLGVTMLACGPQQ